MSPSVSSCLLLLHLLLSSSLSSGYNGREVSGNKNSSRNTISHKEGSTTDITKYDKEESVKFSFLASSSFLEHCKDAGYETLQNGARMFYFFVKAVKEPHSKPIIIWLNGGPGASSLIGFFYENGPFHIVDKFNVKSNGFGWDAIANILYIDQPIGTGLSYARAYTQRRHDRFDVVTDLNQFLQEFMKSYHEYAKKGFYIAGQSYGARFAVSLAYRILLDPKGLKQDEGNNHHNIEIKGIILGNPLIDFGTQYESIPHYVKRNNDSLLIPDEDLGSIFKLIRLCKETIEQCDRTREDDDCLLAYKTCNNILEETIKAINPPKNELNIKSDSVSYDYTNMEAFLNHPTIKSLLNLPAEHVFSWDNPLVFAALKVDWAKNSMNELAKLLKANIEVFIYAGENDIVCNYLGVLNTISKLEWDGKGYFKESLVRDVFLIDEEEAGKYRRFGPLTYIKVYDAGHLVPMDQPKRALAMIDDWITLVST